MMQPTLFEAAKSQRDQIMDAMEAEPAHSVYLRFARTVALDLGHRNGFVTIDDVRAELARQDFPMPGEVGLDARVFGVLFRCKNFVAVEQRPTARKERLARAGIGASYITVYRIREAV